MQPFPGYGAPLADKKQDKGGIIPREALGDSAEVEVSSSSEDNSVPHIWCVKKTLHLPLFMVIWPICAHTLGCTLVGLGNLCMVPSREGAARDSLMQPMSLKKFSTAVAQTSL